MNFNHAHRIIIVHIRWFQQNALESVQTQNTDIRIQIAIVKFVSHDDFLHPMDIMKTVIIQVNHSVVQFNDMHNEIDDDIAFEIS